MIKGTFAVNPYYAEYENLLGQLHEMIGRGAGNSEEAEALRESMEGPERMLSVEELDRLRGLSADLYMLQDDEIVEPCDPSERDPQRLRSQLEKAHADNDWEAILSLLRRGPTNVQRDGIAYLRARAYEQLGHTSTALLFMQYAEKLKPCDPIYKAKIMRLLMKLGRNEEAVARAHAYLEDELSPPILLVASSKVLSSSARDLPEEEGRGIHRRAAVALQRALKQEQARPTLPSSALAMAYGLLGLHYEKIGMGEEATGAYAEALRLVPNSDAILTARGLSLLNSDPAAALEDFKAAVSMNTTLIWPYIWIARESLVRGEYQKCLETCSKLLEMTDEPTVRADVLQWAAIAHFGSDQPIDVVRTMFERAVTLDPLNEEIRRNFETFQRLACSEPQPRRQTDQWETSEKIDPRMARREIEEHLSRPAA